MEDQILNEILKDTYTVDSFKKRFQALRLKLGGEIYQVGTKSTTSTKGTKGGAEKEDEGSNVVESTTGTTSSKGGEEKWLSGFDQGVLKEITSDQFSLMSERVDKYISSLNALTIYFVFLPDQAQIKEIGEWLRKSLNNPKLIFNVKVDAGLIGGCAVVYKGVYKDYSLKAKIAANKEKLIEEFRKYFKQ